MAALTMPTTDSHGSVGRLVTKYFIFASVATGDTFACPVADVRYAAFFAKGSTACSTSVEIGTSTAGVTALTIRTSATTAGTPVVTGTGN